MSIEQTWQLDLDSLSATLDLASKIGSRLKGGEVIELISDLGGGKTTFVKGLASGMGYSDSAHSPSFTLVNEYKTPDKTLYHMDFYRLSDPGIMRNELAEILTNPKAVVAVEWADAVKDVLPAAHLSVKITATGEQSRKFTINAPKNLSYLMTENT